MEFCCWLIAITRNIYDAQQSFQLGREKLKISTHYHRFQVADEIMNGAKSALRRSCPNKPTNIESYKEEPHVARDNGSGIM